MVAFTVVYWFIGSTAENPAFIRSFDIATLAGYTNYGTETGAMQYIQASQLAISAVLYTINFATVVSRFSRVRA